MALKLSLKRPIVYLSPYLGSATEIAGEAKYRGRGERAIKWAVILDNTDIRSRMAPNARSVNITVFLLL